MVQDIVTTLVTSPLFVLVGTVGGLWGLVRLIRFWRTAR